MAPIELNSLGHRGAVKVVQLFMKLHACTYTTYKFRLQQFFYVPWTLPMCCGRRPSYTNSRNSKIRVRVNMAYPISHLRPKIRETKSIDSFIHLGVAKDRLAMSTDPLRPHKAAYLNERPIWASFYSFLVWEGTRTQPDGVSPRNGCLHTSLRAYGSLSNPGHTPATSGGAWSS
jgi:hypothetical protein